MCQILWRTLRANTVKADGTWPKVYAKKFGTKNDSSLHHDVFDNSTHLFLRFESEELLGKRKYSKKGILNVNILPELQQNIFNDSHRYEKKNLEPYKMPQGKQYVKPIVSQDAGSRRYEKE